MSSHGQVTGIQPARKPSPREDWRGALRAQITALLVGLGILAAGYWIVMRPLVSTAPRTPTAPAPSAPPVAVEQFAPAVVLGARARAPQRAVRGQRLSFTWSNHSDM